MKNWSFLSIFSLVLYSRNVFASYFNGNYRTYTFTRPIDLSFAIDDNTAHWDSSQKVSTQRNEIYLPDSTYKSFNKVCFPEHSGTHLDAPSYITKNARKVAEIPIESLIVSGN